MLKQRVEYQVATGAVFTMYESDSCGHKHDTWADEVQGALTHLLVIVSVVVKVWALSAAVLALN